MSDETPTQSTSDDSGLSSSYGTCSCCGMYLHHTQERCPECGARSDETAAAHRPRRGTPFFSLMIAGILGLCLLILSRDRQTYALSEQEAFERLTGQQIPLPEPEPSVTDSTPDPTPRTVPAPTAPTLPAEKPEEAEDRHMEPEPSQLPGPDVVAEPEPDPDPFQGAGPASEGKPEPRPNPFAEPNNKPEPAPEPAAPGVLEQRDQIAEDYMRELDEKYPMAEVGDLVELTLTNNRTLRGRIRRFETRELLLEINGDMREVPYRGLSTESRMRVDKSERNTWALEKAVQDVLNRLSP